MTSKIIRLTLFKIPSKEDQEKAKGLYTTFTNTAVRDGKPYILSLEAGPAYEDARSQGFTFVATAAFANLDDMQYYDNDCEAHKALKEAGKSLGIEKVMMIYYEPSVVHTI